MKFNWGAFLEELENSNKKPKSFDEYLEKKYKKDFKLLKDPLWGWELKLYSALYFNVDKEAEIKFSALIEKYNKEKELEQKSDQIIRQLNEEAYTKKEKPLPTEPVVKRPRGRPRKNTLEPKIKLPTLSSLIGD